MSEEQSDQGEGGSDRGDGTLSKWTVKNVSWEARNAAAMAAKAEGLDLGPWLNRAILRAARSDLKADRAPAVVAPPVRQSDQAGPTVDLGELERMMALAEQYRTITDKPPPRTITGPLGKLMRVRLRAMEGQTGKAPQSDRAPRSDQDEGEVRPAAE